MAQFTDIGDFVLDQIYGYQDANEVKNNTIRLRDAFSDEHVWDNASDTNLGNHKALSIVTAYLDDLAVTEAKLAASSVAAGKIKQGTQTGSGAAAGGSGNTSIALSSVYTFCYILFRFVSGGGAYNATGDINPSVNVTGPSGDSGNVPNDLYIQWSGLAAPGTYHYTVYYIQSSPPYIMVDGVWGLFLFELVDNKSGDVIGRWLSEDPPWNRFKMDEDKMQDDLIAKYPHPWYKSIGEIDGQKVNIQDEINKGNYSVRLVDLRPLNEDVLITPMQSRYRKFVKNARGADLSEHEINYLQTKLADKSSEEKRMQADARNKLASLSQRYNLYKRASGLLELSKKNLDTLEATERYELRRRAGYKHKWEIMDFNERKKESTLLKALEEKRILEIYPSKKIKEKHLPKALVDAGITVLTSD